MLALLLLQAATPQTALEAEWAFAKAAQEQGQWTAFRAFAAPDAEMFVPERTDAQVWLKDRKDPPRSVEWWPTASYVSCDGRIAVNTGGSKWPDGSSGYFTTVWVRQDDGSWKWTQDHGGPLETARARVDRPTVRTADCTRQPRRLPRMITPGTKPVANPLDDTLTTMWVRLPDGSRRFRAFLWNGTGSDAVVDDVLPAPAK